MLKNWFKVFLYNTKKNKLFTALNTLGLSIGIAGIILSVLYWNDENSYEKWNPELENICQVVAKHKDNTWAQLPVAPLKPHLNELKQIEESTATTLYYSEDILKVGKKKQFNKKGISTEQSFFKLYPFKFLEGSKDNCLSDRQSIVISENIANYFFGTNKCIGELITYGKSDYTITGVFKVPGKSGFNPEVITSTSLDELKNNWSTFDLGLFIKVKPKDLQSVTKKINNLFFEHKTKLGAKNEGITVAQYKEQYGEITVKLIPLKNARFKDKDAYFPEGKGNYQFLLIMIVLSFLILVLSIFNYINLSTANAIKRGKEVGVRKVVGASKKNIIYQFVFETLLTTLFAILLALSIVEIILPYYNNFLGKELSLRSTEFIIQLTLILITIVLVAGILPAIYISNFDSLKVLKGNFDRSKGGTWLRNGMLILQFAISSFFIIGSYIVFEQVNHLMKKDLGIDTSQIIQIPYHHKSDIEAGEIMQRYETHKLELLKLKGVKDICLSTFKFTGGASSMGAGYNANYIQALNIPTDYNFTNIFNIKMISGRYFSPKFASDSINSVVINKTMQQLMEEKKPIGKEISWNNDQKLKIVGVINDIDFYGPHKKTEPMLFFYLKKENWMVNYARNIYLKIETENRQQTIADIEFFWKKNISQEKQFEYEYLDKAFLKTYNKYTKQRDLFGILNVFVILISLFGLFSLASFTMQRSMKSIAIRKVLGAETKTLLLQLSKQYILFCVLGFIIAVFPIIFSLNKWLENFSYRIDISVLPFVIGFICLLSLTLIIVLGKAYQATKVDVLTYLKYE